MKNLTEKNRQERVEANFAAQKVVEQLIDSWSAKIEDYRSCQIFISNALLAFRAAIKSERAARKMGEKK